MAEELKETDPKEKGSKAESKEAVLEALQRLEQAVTGVEASAVVTIDGLILASALPESVEEDRVSAMSAALVALGQRITYELNRGYLDQIYIRGTEGDVLLMAVGAEAVLTVMTKPETNFSTILNRMEITAREISELI